MRDKNIRMRIDEDSFLKKKIKEELKDKAIDLVIDQTLGVANITMPLNTLELMIDVFKTLENQLEQGMQR